MMNLESEMRKTSDAVDSNERIHFEHKQTQDKDKAFELEGQ